MLRNHVSKVCSVHGATVSETVQACLDVIMAAVCQSAPNADAARADIDKIAEDLRARIGAAYVEFHEPMAAAQRQLRQ